MVNKPTIRYKTEVSFRMPSVPKNLGLMGIRVVLAKAQRDMLRHVRDALTQSAFSAKAKRALKGAVSIRIKGNTLEVQSHHPGWDSLVRGHRAQPMRWLTKAKSPIPVVTETGEVIFRTATPQSLVSGGWRYPGRRPSSVMEKVRKETQAYLSKRMRSVLADQLRAALRAH